ncbi:nucleoside triphosphate pyrophosphohydrolase [Vibrio gazogenes]|uniref:Nucleoside triphosphate pyrophosphohydrolase n=1 Tax=Vibrio gazogenes DSM 21264 = NBRC 103151 TaxID=1123492 RepID=A0A1M5CP45_VIBGA|nr:nucleoside triphosphate pyrophosphohydrolase [Vibrio gazogenes]USP14182.1 nucleoside triphosphate pyrophosphohydrolase [Vibrio gazogenes]SHF56534.1 ATP diphosphatase [Vibrio gazogenes DSM 21264] [Vibrio gazogenes DSM 21264 = NBRC 103151]SJN55502.1 Nucleoside triphosphate pyrophosphohydrolase [Vibrio gazogenes]
MSHPIEQLKQIMAQLRDPESGCPWDQKQTFESIVPHTVEETYEVIDAIHARDFENLQEELGDFVFQAIFYSQLAQEQGLFDFDDVIRSVNEKLIRRHPHVFSDQVFDNEAAIRANWEKIKSAEKSSAGRQEQSILDGVPKSLPALSRAYKLQAKCAKHGFDWDTLTPVVEKVREELNEVIEEVRCSPQDPAAIEDELGDLLFAVVNLTRHLKHHPESALTRANQKFSRRFQGVEALAKQEDQSLDDYTLSELDRFWEQVKLQEKNQGSD